MEPNPEEEYAEFSDVYCSVYSTLSYIIDENDAVPGRPRLSYFRDERILLVETLSNMHEAPFNHLHSIFSPFLYGLNVFNRSDNYISTSTWRSYMDAVSENYWNHKILLVGECAFAQDIDSVLRKIKHEIASHPEVLMVIMAVIDEHEPYRSPGRMSEAWQVLRQETSICSSSSFCLPRSQRNEAQSLGQPVVIAGHTWCHLASVRFHVWVRGNEPIDVDVDNSELLARGTLFPNQDMDAVDAMIEKGMVMMRDCLASAYQKVAPGSDISALRDSSVAFQPKWDRLLWKLISAVEDTAYGRYRSWYYSSP
ncbi:hypothetical protein EDB19DRAFT_1918537 [Suillus lakei]|nr:hypothetical protein EDB19DRAFT_1918537 [Suillus lakei]